MAPSSITTTRKSKENIILKLYKKYCNKKYINLLLFDVEYLKYTSILILIAELILCIIVIQNVSYTEIDWIAYMQECEGFLNGSTNYAELEGNTGPLVYPAGFVYFYSILYYITSHGTNIRLAQYIFMGIYLLQLALVLRLYKMSRKVPPYVLIITIFSSYRIHSIYLLRLFNDPVAMLFLYAAINLYMDRKWTLGSLFFSLAVSIKMNILLFAPAVLVMFLTYLGVLQTIKQLLVCALLQISFGSPFLLTYPISYIKRSFDLGRVFEHKWTVNYRFLDTETFESKKFHIILLIIHLMLLAAFLKPFISFFRTYFNLTCLEDIAKPQIERENRKRIKSKAKTEKLANEEVLTVEQEKFLKNFEQQLKKTKDEPLIKQPEAELKHELLSIHFEKSIQLALLPLFVCNFIGVITARSLHYQFYVWYFHSLPYLAWCAHLSVPLRFLLLGLIEYCWNTYPSTELSSYLLHFCHIVLLFTIIVRLVKTLNTTSNLKTN